MHMYLHYRHWQDQGYLILYVTARPDMQHRRVVSWLANHNLHNTCMLQTTYIIYVCYRHWQDQGYLILYVTARPDMQHRRVVSWLANHNFPHGMVAFMDGLSKEPLKQKLNYLKGLKTDVSHDDFLYLHFMVFIRLNGNIFSARCASIKFYIICLRNDCINFSVDGGIPPRSGRYTLSCALSTNHFSLEKIVD